MLEGVKETVKHPLQEGVEKLKGGVGVGEVEGRGGGSDRSYSKEGS